MNDGIDTLGRRGWILGALGASASLALGCNSSAHAERQLASRGATYPGTSVRSPYGRAPASTYGASLRGESKTCSSSPTTKDIEGPFFKAGAPEGSEMAKGLYGMPFSLSGNVSGIDCGALSQAVLEVWQADMIGQYDNKGFSLRTKLVTDARGNYHLTSILPGHYKNGDQFRPAHVHVKVHHPDHPTLTTQLYFKGDPYNAIDPWFAESRALDLESDKGVKTARFDFVLG